MGGRGPFRDSVTRTSVRCSRLFEDLHSARLSLRPSRASHIMELTMDINSLFSVRDKVILVTVPPQLSLVRKIAHFTLGWWLRHRPNDYRGVRYEWSESIHLFTEKRNDSKDSRCAHQTRYFLEET